MRRKGRRSDPRIVDPANHPRQSVSLRVAAEYLGMNERTLRARIEEGKLPAFRDEKVYRIRLADLVAYEQRHAC